MTPSTSLAVMWLVFAVLSLAAIAAVLVWAVRARQFSGQDRARYLALRSRIVPPGAPDGPSAGGGASALQGPSAGEGPP